MFLIDPPLLYAGGRLWGQAEPERAQGRATQVLGAATISAFWITSISLYLNKEWTRPIWETYGSEDGRDFMINSRVFKFDHKNPGTRGHTAAALLFASYPLWLALGYRHGRRRNRRLRD